MKECLGCGLMNPDDAECCPACGSRDWPSDLPLQPSGENNPGVTITSDPGESSVMVCPGCARPNPTSARWCVHCRGPLSGGAGVVSVFNPGTVPQSSVRTGTQRVIATVVWVCSIPVTAMLILSLGMQIGRPDDYYGLEDLVPTVVFLAVSAFLTIAGIHQQVWRRH